ncbi:MAG: acyl dehydratase, partial [Pseudomonadota bacterium]
AISERQDIVYLKIPERFSPPVATPAPEAPDHAETVEIDTVRLFRYSACTFNAHRIHYDLAYAQEVEKYPGLVVHGPLQATLLMDAATRWRGAAPKTFRFRGVRPMFHTHALHMFGVNAEEDAAHAMDLCTADPGGAQGMQARATWA